MERDIHDLARGERFIGPADGATYEVITPASEHPMGWVDVRNLSLTDEQVAEVADEMGRDGADPREGCFAYPGPMAVEVIAADETTDTSDHDDTNGM